MCRSHSLWRRVMFVCRITQKLHDRFPQNSDGGLVSAQNRSHRPLVQIQIKDTDGLRCRWCHHAAEVPTWMPFRRTKCGGVPSLHYKYITTGGGIFFYLVHPCTLNILHCPGIFSHFLWHPEHFFFTFSYISEGILDVLYERTGHVSVADIREWVHVDQIKIQI